MQAFATSRRPRVVYGGKKARRPRNSSVSSSDDQGSSNENAAGPSEDRESDAVEVESMLMKENVAPSERYQCAGVKGKKKLAAPPRTKLPMQTKERNTVIDLTSDSDDDDSIGDMVRSPHRRQRNGQMRRTLLEDSSDEEDGAMKASSSTAGLDGLMERMRDGLRVSEQEGDVDSTMTSLLAACQQDRALDFDKTLDKIEQISTGSRWHKVGEATYSEVFAVEASGLVVKVIPLACVETEAGSDYPECSPTVDVEREVRMTKALCQVDDAFVRLHSCHVVRGRYPDRLIRAWDEKRRIKKDQNRRPDVFHEDQLYCLLTLTDAGTDLEAFQPSTWLQVASIVLQVTRALAKAENAYDFEHRDLHWGNVIIRSTAPLRAESIHTEREIADPSRSGIRATIIDFTLSRAALPGSADQVSAHPLDDPAFFTGSGDIQFDVYRDMRDVSALRWTDFHPYTNVLWLRYLLAKLMDDKQLEAPESDGHESLECTYYDVLRQVREKLDEEMNVSAKRRTIKSSRGLSKAFSDSIRARTKA